MSPRKTDIFFVPSPDVQHFCPSVHLPHKGLWRTDGQNLCFFPRHSVSRQPFVFGKAIWAEAKPTTNREQYQTLEQREQKPSDAKPRAISNLFEYCRGAKKQGGSHACLSYAESRQRKAKPRRKAKPAVWIMPWRELTNEA